MKRKVSLTVVEGSDKGMTFNLQSGSATMGRAKNELTLTDKKVSGKHCRVFVEGDQVFIEDLNSTNGTFVGTRKITTKVALQNLDQIIIGLSKISVAIIDDMQGFKEHNLSTETSGVHAGLDLEDDLSSEDDAAIGGLLEDSEHSAMTKTRKGSLSTPAMPSSVDNEGTVKASGKPEAAPELDLPAEDAVYRDTGIQRIDNLIADELDTFSKWDHPSVKKSTSKAEQVPRVKVTLEPRRGPEGTVQVICTEATTSFGRKDVDVRLSDLDVSRKHCAIEIVGGRRVFVRDLASTNGTFVNGKKISYQQLNPGDLLQVGQTIFEIGIDGGEG